MSRTTPTTAQLRMLADLANGRIRRTRSGWQIGGATATASDTRTLTTCQARGWVTLTQPGPLAEGESTAATLNDTGHAVLTRQWPAWRPRTTRGDV